MRTTPPSVLRTTVFHPATGGRWNATTETPAGPVTAVADTMGEAQHALDELLVIARALEVTRSFRRGGRT